MLASFNCWFAKNTTVTLGVTTLETHSIDV